MNPGKSIEQKLNKEKIESKEEFLEAIGDARNVFVGIKNICSSIPDIRVVELQEAIAEDRIETFEEYLKNKKKTLSIEIAEGSQYRAIVVAYDEIIKEINLLKDREGIQSVLNKINALNKMVEDLRNSK